MALFGAAVLVDRARSTPERSESPASSKATLATVHGAPPVLAGEFERAWHQEVLAYQIMRRDWPAPSSSLHSSLRERVLQLLVRRRVLALEAARLGVRVSESELRQSLEQIREDIFDGDRKAYRRDLAQKGVTDAENVEAIGSQILERKLYSMATKNVYITEVEARRYYQLHLKEFSIGISRQIAFATFPSRGRALAMLRREGKIRNELLQTVTVERERTSEEVWNIVARLEGNAIGPPLKLDENAWYLIRPLGPIQPRHTKRLSEIEPALRDRLLKEEKARVFEKWVKDAVRRADVRYVASS